MKKFIIALLALALVLTGCQMGEKQEPTQDSGALPTVSTAPTQPEPTQAPTEAPTTEPSATEPDSDAPVTVRRIEKIVCLQPWGWEYETCWVKSYAFQDGKLSMEEGGLLRGEYTFHPGTTQVATSAWYEYYREDIDRTQSEYDEQGHLICQTDAYGDQVRYVYNEFGDVVEQISVYSDGVQYGLETWVYNEAGQQIEYIQTIEGVETVREVCVYDAQSYMVDYVEYLDGQQVSQTTWVYDENGNLLENRYNYDADGEFSSYYYDSYVYDEAGNLVESFHEGDDPSNYWCYRVLYGFDEATNTEVNTYIYMEYDDEITLRDTFTYDENGNLLHSVTHYNMDGWFTKTNDYTYDEAGNLIEEHLIEEYEYDEEPYWNTRVTYAYDEAGRKVEQVTYEDGEETERITWQYGPGGQELGWQYFEEGALVYEFACQYDEAGQLIDARGKTILSLREEGDELLIWDDGETSPCYLAVTYETLTLSPAEAEIVENINQFILGSL